jgi:hypothetical protein
MENETTFRAVHGSPKRCDSDLSKSAGSDPWTCHEYQGYYLINTADSGFVEAYRVTREQADAITAALNQNREVSPSEARTN